MEQRRPRLGDVLDDYCPRERRLANHVVVAMIGDEIKQTRCTTCDTEHPYKHAKIPSRRSAKPAPGVLVKPAPEAGIDRPRLNGEVSVPALASATSSLPADAPVAAGAPTASVAMAPPSTPTLAPPAAVALDEGPVHRPLIRATLPRPEGEVKERPIPEFTMRAIRNFRGTRHGAGRPAGKRQARGATPFQPGVMSSWSRSNPRQPGGQPPQARPHQARPPGGKKRR